MTGKPLIRTALIETGRSTVPLGFCDSAGSRFDSARTGSVSADGRLDSAVGAHDSAREKFILAGGDTFSPHASYVLASASVDSADQSATSARERTNSAAESILPAAEAGVTPSESTVEMAPMEPCRAEVKLRTAVRTGEWGQTNRCRPLCIHLTHSFVKFDFKSG